MKSSSSKNLSNNLSIHRHKPSNLLHSALLSYYRVYTRKRYWFGIWNQRIYISQAKGTLSCFVFVTPRKWIVSIKHLRSLAPLTTKHLRCIGDKAIPSPAISGLSEWSFTSSLLAPFLSLTVKRTLTRYFTPSNHKNSLSLKIFQVGG